MTDNCSPEELQSLMPQSRETHVSSSLESQGYSLPLVPFKVALFFSHVIGILIIVLTIIWSDQFLGGFGWTEPAQEFNYHPLFLIIGMIYLYGNSIISYRVLPSLDKTKLKLLHSFLHFACLIFTATGLYAVIDFHNRANIANFYSLHSWIGIFSVVIYFLQWSGSLYVFLYPGIKPTYRALVLPFHVRGGLLIFGVSVGACLTGITEKIIFSLTASGYSQLPPSAYFANFIGISIILYSFIIAYLVTESAFARKNKNTDSKTSISLSDSRRQ